MTNRYDLYCRIQWRMTGTRNAPITPKRANPLIKQLAERLQNYVFKRKTISARLIGLDEHFNLGYTNDECRGGWNIVRFDVIDTSPNDSERCHNFNSYIKPALAKDLGTIFFRKYSIYAKIIMSFWPSSETIVALLVPFF